MEPKLKMLALFDVLGFESRLNCMGLNGINSAYESLIKHVQPAKARVVRSWIPDSNGKFSWCLGTLVVEQAYFSDTIIVWADFGPYWFDGFCDICSALMCQSLRIGLPLRGAISVGEAILDNSSRIYLGSPLVQAARMEAARRWIGVSLCPMPIQFHVDPQAIMEYSLHFKDGLAPKPPCFVLDWSRQWRKDNYGDLKASISNLDADPRFSEYYSNTLSFVEFSEKNQNWYQRNVQKDTPNKTLHLTGGT